MRKVIINVTTGLFIMICFLSSCKEIHKMNKEAENEAEAEIKSEELDKEIKALEKLPKTESEIRYEESKEQQIQMDNDKSILFSKNKDIGFKYTEIKEIKINGKGDDSEINLKYKIYVKTKELKGDGIIDYKVSFTPFYASGIIVKRQ